MKERPILFSGEMVRAILAGRKTQTRRVIRQRDLDRMEGLMLHDSEAEMWCPYGRVSDRLWVRETFSPGTLAIENKEADNICYRAGKCPCGDEGKYHWHGTKWKPSIFMPRWASRITLEIVSVRVERIQDISESDAKAEGITNPAEIAHLRAITEKAGLQYCPHKMAYSELWDELNEERGFGWDVNPWVWAIEFRRVE